MSDSRKLSLFPHADYVVLDLETTGLSPARDAIIEVAIIKVIQHKPVEVFQTFVDPRFPVPWQITRITGIRNEDVCSADPIEKVLPWALQFIGDLPVLGWNVTFDLAFLENNARTPVSFTYLDVLPLARGMWPDLESYRLTSLSRRLGVRESSHRALDDCVAAMDIYNRILKQAKIENRSLSYYWRPKYRHA